ncbi:unnamed protein product [Arctogadus glacialis]
MGATHQMRQRRVNSCPAPKSSSRRRHAGLWLSHFLRTLAFLLWLLSHPVLKYILPRPQAQQRRTPTWTCSATQTNMY